MLAGTAITGVLGMSAMQKAPDPPALPDPASDPAPTHTSNATVRVGGDQLSTTTDTTAPEYVPFTEQRSSGKALGGLGRGGLGL